MAKDQHEPNSASEPIESQPAADDAVVEAELIDADPAATDSAPEATPASEQVPASDPAPAADPVEGANASLAAAAAAASAPPTPEPAPAAAPSEGAPVAPATWQLDESPETPAPQYVVVEAPQPPRRRGNRGIGTLLAIAGAVIYGGILVGVGAILELLAGRSDFAFLQDWHFYLPTAIFALAFVVLVLLVNRAGWWSHIFGSLFVGLAVYLGTASSSAIIDVWLGSADPTTIASGLATPFVIIAGVLAREVAVWWGSLIAYRGRRVTARNRAQQEAYERELAEFRQRYGG